MNKTGLIIFFFFIRLSCLHAQDGKQFTVSAGQTIYSAMAKEEIYEYPNFVKSVIRYKDHTTSTFNLNYNIFLGKIQFISSRKDTLVVSNPEKVQNFVLGTDTFIYLKDYYRILAGNQRIRLLAKHYTKLVDVRKEGAYGASSSTSATDNYTSFSSDNNSKLFQLRVKEETVFSIRTEYFFLNAGEELFQATKNNLLRQFPDQADEIKSYIKDQSIRFNKLDDLRKILTYVQKLK